MKFWPFRKRESLDTIFARFTEHFIGKFTEYFAKNIMPSLEENKARMRQMTDAFDALREELFKERTEKKNSEKEKSLADEYDNKY